MDVLTEDIWLPKFNNVQKDLCSEMNFVCSGPVQCSVVVGVMDLDLGDSALNLCSAMEASWWDLQSAILSHILHRTVIMNIKYYEHKVRGGRNILNCFELALGRRVGCK